MSISSILIMKVSKIKNKEKWEGIFKVNKIHRIEEYDFPDQRDPAWWQMKKKFMISWNFFKSRDKEKSEKLTEILLAIDGKKSESSSFTITIIKMDILYEATAFRHLMTGNTNCNLWGRQNCWGEPHDYCRLCLGIHCRP